MKPKVTLLCDVINEWCLPQHCHNLNRKTAYENSRAENITQTQRDEHYYYNYKDILTDLFNRRSKL